MTETIHPVRLDDENDAIVILDQTALPTKTVYLELKEIREIWDAIYTLKVRGAPAIGITAGYGVYLGAKKSRAHTVAALYEDFKKAKNYLETSRPTAVNLFWALARMESRFAKEASKQVTEIKAALREEADLIREEDERICKAIGENTLCLLAPGWGILTHCNAGALATSGYGTALSAIYLGQHRGFGFKVYADETRPLLQGARLTAWELHTSGIDVTLICDNMAPTVMNEGKIQAVLVGCDRVARNGDAANKIGTSGLAILAKYYNIPFYVCCPLPTVDLGCQTGGDISIEMRPAYEVTTQWFSYPMAPSGVKVYNPSFDVTHHSLISAIITENGVVSPPYSVNLPAAIKRT